MKISGIDPVETQGSISGDVLDWDLVPPQICPTMIQLLFNLIFLHHVWDNPCHILLSLDHICHMIVVNVLGEILLELYDGFHLLF